MQLDRGYFEIFVDSLTRYAFRVAQTHLKAARFCTETEALLLKCESFWEAYSDPELRALLMHPRMPWQREGLPADAAWIAVSAVQTVKDLLLETPGSSFPLFGISADDRAAALAMVPETAVVLSLSWWLRFCRVFDSRLMGEITCGPEAESEAQASISGITLESQRESIQKQCIKQWVSANQLAFNNSG